MENNANSTAAFTAARDAWHGASELRSTRRMLKQFTYGRQWDAIAESARRGAALADLEKNFLKDGRRPLTNNLVRSLVKSVVGRFRKNLSLEEHPDETSSEGRMRRRNTLDELDARALEEFLISGCAVQRIVLERRFEGTDVWVDNVNPARFFCNRFHDPRGSDIRLVGMLHDMSLPELLSRFGHGSRRRQRELSALFDESVRLRGRMADCALATLAADGEVSFSSAADPSLCRVIEVWTLEITRNGDPRWTGRYFSPEGKLIDETPSPYPHRSHPFVVSLYPLTDGEVHPFIEDIIDQQRHVNVLMALVDHIIAHSAKGVLLLPQDSLPPDTDMRLVSEAWSKPGGVIVISRNASRLPQEINTASSCAGATQLLDREMLLFQQISGVTQALQGQTPSGNTSASLYQSQIENASIALLDIFETFNTFRARRSDKARALLDAR